MLSEGRVILGVGVGWMREEFEAIGIPSRDEERARPSTFASLKALWTEDPGELRRRIHARFDGIVLATKPHSQGGPPVWIGGNTEPACGGRSASEMGGTGSRCSPTSYPS